MHKALLILGIFLVSEGAMASSPRYVDFISDGPESVISIQLATPGHSDWVPVKLNGVVDGGYVEFEGGYVGQALVAVNVDRGCLYDVRIEFASQKMLTVKEFNVCRMHNLDISQAWWRDSLGRAAAPRQHPA
ncbi:MAG: hypothetical protein WA777_08735 [Rhodanobacter sp.]